MVRVGTFAALVYRAESYSENVSTQGARHRITCEREHGEGVGGSSIPMVVKSIYYDHWPAI